MTPPLEHCGCDAQIDRHAEEVLENSRDWTAGECRVYAHPVQAPGEETGNQRSDDRGCCGDYTYHDRDRGAPVQDQKPGTRHPPNRCADEQVEVARLVRAIAPKDRQGTAYGVTRSRQWYGGCHQLGRSWHARQTPSGATS